MKKIKKAWFVGPIIVLSMYLVFYSEIDSSPNEAGFWFILALGMSISAVICKLSKKK